MNDWAKLIGSIGVPAVIVFYLLGMIPGVRSPFDRITEQLHAAASMMNDHERTSREVLRINRQICRGIWKGDALGAALCGRQRDEPGQ